MVITALSEFVLKGFDEETTLVFLPCKLRGRATRSESHYCCFVGSTSVSSNNFVNSSCNAPSLGTFPCTHISLHANRIETTCIRHNQFSTSVAGAKYSILDGSLKFDALTNTVTKFSALQVTCLNAEYLPAGLNLHKTAYQPCFPTIFLKTSR